MLQTKQIGLAVFGLELHDFVGVMYNLCVYDRSQEFNQNRKCIQHVCCVQTFLAIYYNSML